MITEIRLKNFKCFRELTKVPLKKINVFIGPNGSGKSTPLQALMLLKQSVGQQQLMTRGSDANLGPVEHLIFQGATTMTLGVSLAVSDVAAVAYCEDVVLSRNGTIEIIDRSLDVRNLPLDTGRELLSHQLAWRYTRGEGENWEKEREASVNGQRIVLQSGVAILWGFGTNQQKANAILRNVVEQVGAARAVPATRGIEEPLLVLGQQRSEDFHLADVPSQRPREIATTLVMRRDVEDRINEWFEGITGIKVQSSVEERQQVSVQAIGPSGRVNIVNEGFGSNQLVHLLLQLALCARGALLAIDEPESHLHPKAQVALVKVLLKQAKEQDLQLVLVTHSEHVLHALLNKVAQGQLTPEEFGILYFQKEGAVAKVKPLNITDKGMVEGGLPGFFEAELDQLNEFMEALSKRK